MDLKDLSKAFLALPNDIKAGIGKRKEYLAELKEKFLGLVGKLEAKDVKALRISSGQEKIDSVDKLTDFLQQEIDKINTFASDAPPLEDEKLKLIRNLFWHSNGKIKKDWVEIVPVGSDFYRMRRSDDSYQVYDKKGLYMLSSDDDRFAGMARYNLARQTCLYLASTLYTAWEELRRPDFYRTNFVRFRCKKELTVLDLTIPPRPDSLDLILRSYLCLVCSVKANDSDKAPWPYTLPTDIMSVLANHLLKIYGKDGKHPVGIRYLSSRRFDCKDFNVDNVTLATAYVFPPQSRSDEKYCSKVASAFEMTDPISYFFLKVHRQRFIPVNAPLVSDYQHTIFYELEQILKTRPLFPCSKLLNL